MSSAIIEIYMEKAVKRQWGFGIMGPDDTGLRKRTRLPWIASIDPKGIAAKSGLQIDDAIVRINDTNISPDLSHDDVVRLTQLSTIKLSMTVSRASSRFVL